MISNIEILSRSKPCWSETQDLKDVTNNVHYENHRFKKLAYVTCHRAKPNNNRNRNEGVFF